MAGHVAARQLIVPARVRRRVAAAKLVDLLLHKDSPALSKTCTGRPIVWSYPRLVSGMLAKPTRHEIYAASAAAAAAAGAPTATSAAQVSASTPASASAISTAATWPPMTDSVAADAKAPLRPKSFVAEKKQQMEEIFRNKMGTLGYKLTRILSLNKDSSAVKGLAEYWVSRNLLANVQLVPLGILVGFTVGWEYAAGVIPLTQIKPFKPPFLISEAAKDKEQSLLRGIRDAHRQTIINHIKKLAEELPHDKIKSALSDSLSRYENGQENVTIEKSLVQEYGRNVSTKSYLSNSARALAAAKFLGLPMPHVMPATRVAQCLSEFVTEDRAMVRDMRTFTVDYPHTELLRDAARRRGIPADDYDVLRRECMRHVRFTQYINEGSELIYVLHSMALGRF